MKKPKEGDLVRACLQYLAVRGILAFRNNSGVFPDSRGVRRIRAGVIGAGDILGVLPESVTNSDREPPWHTAGRLLSIETKSPAGRLTVEQRAWMERAGADGALCIVCRSLDSLREQLAEAGYPER